MKSQFDLPEISKFQPNLASLHLQPKKVDKTVIDHDIEIFEYQTPFQLHVDLELEDHSKLGLELDVLFTQIDDEWSGFLVRKATPTHPTEKPFFADLHFKQSIQGRLYSNHELLDTLITPVHSLCA